MKYIRAKNSGPGLAGIKSRLANGGIHVNRACYLLTYDYYSPGSSRAKQNHLLFYCNLEGLLGHYV